MEQLKIGIIGAGAIGGVTAAQMADKGYDIELVCKHKEIADIIKNDGIEVTGVVNKKIKLNAVEKVSDFSGRKDIIMIVTKAYDMQQAARDALPFADENTLFVSMQNGICIDALAEIVGKERTVGCVIGFGGTMTAPAKLVKTSEGDFIIGMYDGCSSPLLPKLKDALETVSPVHITDKIYEELYSKLLVNSCITALGAICGLTLGKMLKIKKLRNLFIEIMREGMDVANALGIRVPPYANKIDYYKMTARKGGFSDFKRHLVIRVVGIKYKNLKSSSLQSLERGGKAEIGFFNGYIVSKGKELGIPTPVNDKIVAMVSEIENKSRPMTLDNFKEF